MAHLWKPCQARPWLKEDFLTFIPEQAGPWVVVGNPPFGKNSSLALRFFNQAARFADVIAFIVPRTFEKDSLQRRLSPNMHLVLEKSLDANSFLLDGQRYSVPCVFQVWQRRDTARIQPPRRLSHPDFEFTTRDRADFAFQRVGVAAGKLKSLDHPALAPPSHHFLRAVDRKKVSYVRTTFESVCWKADKYKTAGNPSISKHEMIEAYDKAAIKTP
jgi:hypothetical protein